MSDYFTKDIWSGSEITATVGLVIGIEYSVYWARTSKIYFFKIFIYIMILVLYYVLKYQNILPLGLGTNIVYFVITIVIMLYCEYKMSAK
jgi:hypothetical protein